MRFQRASNTFIAVALMFIGVATAPADEATRIGIHAVMPISPDATNLSVVQQAITQHAHVVHFDLRKTDEGDLVVLGGATLRAALAVAKDKILVDLDVDDVAAEEVVTALDEAGAFAQTTLHARDTAKLQAIRALAPAAQLRAPVGADAKTLGAGIVTLDSDALSSRSVGRLHDAGTRVWVDTGNDSNLRGDAMDAEVDFISAGDISGLVRDRREAGYYAARPILQRWPVPEGTELSLEGTRWKRGKHTLIFHAEPVIAVKGGIVDRFFRNGVKGEYSLDDKGVVKINVKGRKGTGTFDGNYLQTDGVECVRLEP